jgi:hypothetical protein
VSGDFCVNPAVLEIKKGEAMKVNHSVLKKSFLTGLILALLLIVCIAPVAASAPKYEAHTFPQVAVQQEATSTSQTPFAELAFGGIGIVGFVTGTVAWVKKLGVKGTWLTVSSLVIGLIFGVAYKYYLTPLTTYQLWFGAVLYGLFLGFVACGIYDSYGNNVTDTTVNNTTIMPSADQAAAAKEVAKIINNAS